MELSAKKDNSQFHYQIKGTFTFSDSNKFREIVRDVEHERPTHIFVDFAQAEFVDSAALGMLLLLHDIGKENNITIELHNAAGQIKKMFELSKFSTLFTIR